MRRLAIVRRIVTPGAVAAHVASAEAKLDARSRREVIDLLGGHWDPPDEADGHPDHGAS
jgi:hypothetical protein